MKITTLEASGAAKLSALELHASLKPPLVSQGLHALQSFCGASLSSMPPLTQLLPRGKWRESEKRSLPPKGIICSLLAQFIMNFLPPPPLGCSVDMAWEEQNEIIIYWLRFLICHRLSSLNSGFADCCAPGRNGISSRKRETSVLCSDSFSPLLCILR